MSLHLTNTLGGQLEEFKPIEPGRVAMYSCGPTVYGPAHIGNFRAFVLGDLARRYLEWSGYEVTWVMNITDVDDRIIRDLQQTGGTLDELTAPHIARFMADMADLRIGPPTALVRATEHIPEMAELIATLIDKGHAYRVTMARSFSASHRGRPTGGWRDSIRMRRASATVSQPMTTARTTRATSLCGKAPSRASHPGDSHREGRPGWHIECSAMSMSELGETFDIHTGGVDLIFPHHENEIAQSEAATGKRFVNYWLHNAHLQLGGQKMARRVGNIAKPAEVYAEGYTPTELRYALIATHYRAPLEWGDDTLDHARAAVERLSTAVAALEAYTEERASDATLDVALDAARERFKSAMDDDLNVSGGLGAIFDLVRELNRRVDARVLSTADAQRGAVALRDFDTVLAIIDEREALPDGAQALLDARAAARAARDWSASDRLRDELAGLGVAVEDTRDGQRWRSAARATDA